LSPPPAAAAPIESLAAAPALPDLWPPVKPLRGVIGFLRRYPTIAIGAALVLLMVLMAVLAPYLWTVDPTTLNTSRRTRAPSEL
jgi:peptide/nickel transport system permease protein